MNHPKGLTIDGTGRLWVAEEDFQPKRVNVWSADGKLATAFYGPSEYGGGGRLDPRDQTRFYYCGMEFNLDWERDREHDDAHPAEPLELLAIEEDRLGQVVETDDDRRGPTS